MILEAEHHTVTNQTLSYFVEALRGDQIDPRCGGDLWLDGAVTAVDLNDGPAV